MAIPQSNQEIIEQLQAFLQLQRDVDPVSYSDDTGASILSAVDGTWGARTHRSLVEFISSDPALAERIPLDNLGTAQTPPDIVDTHLECGTSRNHVQRRRQGSAPVPGAG